MRQLEDSMKIWKVRLKFTTLLGIISVLLGCWCLADPWITVESLTCVECRLGLARKTYSWLLASRVCDHVVESPCSLWWRDNVRAEHVHVFAHAAEFERRDLFGLSRSFVSRDESLIWRLSATDQLRVYQKCAQRGTVDDCAKVFRQIHECWQSGDRVRGRALMAEIRDGLAEERP